MAMTQDATAEQPGERDLQDPGRRRRYGRQRGLPPPGEWFVARLGPAADEPFAAIDDLLPESPPERPHPSTPIEELRFVSLDCETTGQTPHRLVELGAVAFTVNGHIASFETLVHCTDRINPYARRLHGITSATLAGAPRAEAVLERFRHFAAGAVLIEHSADAFDTRLIARTTGRPVEADSIDTSRLAGKLWNLRDTIGLERLCTELGIAHRGPHTALGDAEATAACFLVLLGRGRTLFGWRTLADLLADGQPPPPRILPPAGQRRRPRGPVPATAQAATDGDQGGDAVGTTTASPENGEANGGEDAPRRRRRRGGRRRRRAPGEAAGEAGPEAAGGSASAGDAAGE